MSQDAQHSRPGRAGEPRRSPRAHRSRPFGVIFFALGLIAQLDEGPVDGRLLIRVAADLGLSASAARAAILRLRREGMLHSERSEFDGRQVRYSVTEEIAAMQRRWTEHFRSGPPPWDGVFAGLLHDFPERDRARRDAFRRAARFAGYGLLRPGLLVSPDDRWAQLAERFTVDERDGRILQLGLTLALDDARAIAAELWQLDTLARRYQLIAERTHCQLRIRDREGAGPTGALALRRLHELTRPIYDAIAQDPALPAALLPEDWPAPELGTVLTDAFQRLAPGAIARVRALQTRID